MGCNGGRCGAASAVNENHVINSIKFCVNRVSCARQQAFNETFAVHRLNAISFRT